jgi:lantibiotic modifying enzyme
MEISVLVCHYSLHTGNKIYADYTYELKDEIYEEITKSTPVDFANGLAGISWGIEYLVKNKFVQTDTDEALSEIDSVFYPKRIKPSILINESDDLFGYGIFK